MKKIIGIIIVAAIASIFAFAGCEKQEAQKPAEKSAPTMTTAPSTTSAPTSTMNMPMEKK